MNKRKEKSEKIKRKAKINELTEIALTVAFIAVCSFVTVSGAVPFTLQTLGIFLALGFLGGRKGTVAVVCYVLLGLAGAPVFSGFRGGFPVLAGATGGYIFGFIVGALAYWGISVLFGNKLYVKAVGMAVTLAVVYCVGTAWFAFVTGKTKSVDFASVFAVCVLPFIPFDVAKIAVAIAIIKPLSKHVFSAKR